MRWRPAVGAAALGYLPAAAVYATAGTVATSFPHGAAVFLGVVALAAATAVLVRKPLRSHAGPASRRIA